MRSSNFELLRLVSMFFIVLYHILLFIIVDIDNSPIYKAMWIPLHVAVICFVLISGYFHIRPSLRGGIKLIIPLLIYYLPLTILELVNGVGSIKNLLFFSKSPYWYIRTYLCLFLMAPALNAYLTSNRRRLYLLIALGFIAIYMGNLHESSLRGGKNLSLFMFLYVIGDSLRANKSIYEGYSLWKLVLVWFLLNVILVLGFMMGRDAIIGKVLWLMSFPYCSPILITNATLLFVIFAKLEIRSNVINWLSSSVLSVYIIHHQHYVLYSIIGVAALYGYRILTSPAILFLYLSALTVIVNLLCIM